MTPRDLAALSPLITLQIDTYRRYELDMEARLPLAARASNLQQIIYELALKKQVKP